MSTTPGGLTTPGVVKTTNEILISLAPEITMVKQFTYDISSTVADYGTMVRIPFLTAGAVEEYDDSTKNYEHPTGSMSDLFVQLTSQPKVTIPLTSQDLLELPNDSFWGKAKEASVNVISKAISSAICGNFTKANIEPNGTDRQVPLAVVDTSAIAQLRNKAASKGRIADYVLVLDGEAYADLLSVLPANIYGNTDPIQNGVLQKIYGFKSIICSYDLPSGIRGVLVPADGLAVAIRPVAIPDPAAYPECGVVTDEQGFALTAMRHTSFATAKAFYNVTTLIGTKLIRPEATFYIVDAQNGGGED